MGRSTSSVEVPVGSVPLPVILLTDCRFLLGVNLEMALVETSGKD